MRNILVVVVAACVSGVAVPAWSQTGYFQGLTPRPADVFQLPASLTVTRSAPAGGREEVVPALYTHVTTDPEARTFEWANLSILKNYSNYGANVATYGQAHKFGRGTSWAGVMELQDAHGKGGFYALEIDAYSTGPSPTPAARRAIAWALASSSGALSTPAPRPRSTTACSSRRRRSTIGRPT